MAPPALGIRRFGCSERRQCRRSTGRLLIENKHFVAFRTLDPRFLSAHRLLACGSGMELAGRTALLTGATGGLGRAIAKALAERGASLALSARKAEALEALAAELPGDGHRVLRGRPGRARRCRELAAEAGEVDILVANAGLPGAGLARRLHSEEVEPCPAGQPRGADADGAGALPGDGRARLRPPGLRLLALRQGGQPPQPRSTTRPSSACAASPSACAPTWRRAASASRSSRPASSAKPGCSPSRGRSRRRDWGPRRPSRSASAVVRAIEHDRVELAVAPLPQRVAGPSRASPAPSISVRVPRAAPPARRRPRRSPTATPTQALASGA